MLKCLALPASAALQFRLVQLHPYVDHLGLSCELGPRLLLGLQQRVLAGEVARQGLALGLQEDLGLAVGRQSALLLPENDGEQARSLPLLEHPEVHVEVVRLAELEGLPAFELPLREGLDGELQFLFAVLLRQDRVEAGLLLPELGLLGEEEVLPERLEDLPDDAHVSGLVVRLLDEEHLLLAAVAVEDVLDLLEGDQLVPLRGDEDARRCHEIDQRLEVYLVDVEVSPRQDDRLYVLVGHAQKNLRQVGPLLPDLQEQLPEGLEGTVEYCSPDGLAIQGQETQGWIAKGVPVTAPMDLPQRQNLAS